MSERRFTRALHKPGMAAQLRETMSQVVRDTATQNKAPELVEPIDYEAFILKNKTLLQNDPQRELLLYPSDDVSLVVLPRRTRTVLPPVPGCLVAGEDQLGQLAHGPLLARECLRGYRSNWNLVHYKYNGYAGSYLELPKLPKGDDLRDEVYEIDADIDEYEEGSRSDGITKKGYLLKGPESGQDRMFANLASKTFKRRFCYLRRQVDGTYILELHKPDKPERQGEPKSTIMMDFCTDVAKNPKRGRFAFELRLSGGGGTGGSTKLVCLAAESEGEMSEWIAALNAVLQQNRQSEDRRSTLDKVAATPPPSPQQWNCGTLKGLEQSMIPELMRYARETDSSIAAARQDNRRRVFAVCPYLPLHRPSTSPVCDTAGVEPYKEQFGFRLLVRCDSLSFKLQANDEPASQIEPYFTTLALYDARDGRKLSEDFHFNLNSEEAREMLRSDGPLENGDAPVSNGLTAEAAYPPEWSHIPQGYLDTRRQAILSVREPHGEVFLVVRVEKVLQGAIAPSAEPYLRSGRAVDPKLASRTHKAARACCQRLGKYRMPFAWCARPLFRPASGQLDSSAEFSPLYRQDPTRLSDEELLKMLQDFRKVDKMSRLTVIPASINISVQALTELPENCLTSSLAPLKPFCPTSATAPSLEVAEFEPPATDEPAGSALPHPYTVPAHHLYVYPRALNFETQKSFARARNLAMTVELRDSDKDDAKPLMCFYSVVPGSDSLLETSGSCSVLHHCRAPCWYTELKLRLPVCLTPSHHLLFRLHHVQCDLSKRNSGSGGSNSAETSVGFAWLPLLAQGRIVTEEHSLPVAATLPAGYLSIQPLGLGKGPPTVLRKGHSPQLAGPEATWLDGRKQLLTVSLRLASTLATTDVHLHNLFAHAERLLEPKHAQPPPSDQETSKIIKAGHAIHVSALLSFLPTVLSLLLSLLSRCASAGTVGLDTVRLMVHVAHQAAGAGRQDALHAFVKYVYGSGAAEGQSCAVHEQLAKHLPELLLQGNPADPQLVLRLMRHSGLFLEIMAKSMAQHLLLSGRIKMLRNERFSEDFLTGLSEMLDALAPCVTSRFREAPSEAQELNRSIANFIKRCLSLMDRGAVFRLAGQYAARFSGGEHLALSEYKFAFLRVVCSHEHFVPLNLPLAPAPLSPSRMRKSDAGQPWCAGQLSTEFCQQHFMAGLLLREVQHALTAEAYQARRAAVATLRDLMAKHELDDRYQNKSGPGDKDNLLPQGQLARIASLYLPWLEVVLENRERLAVTALPGASLTSLPQGGTASVAESSSQLGGSSSLLASQVPLRDSASLPPLRLHHRNTLHLDSNGSPFRGPLGSVGSNRDSACFAAISGQGRVGGSTASLESDDSTVSGDALSGVSQETAIARGPGSLGRAAASASPQPCPMMADALQASETRDILLCFLFVVKHVGDQSLVAWWQHCSQQQLLGFFQLLHMSVLRFRYTGRRQGTGGHKPSLSVSAQSGMNGTSPARANTLPARMQPPDFASAPFCDEPSSPVSNKGLVEWGRTATQQCLMEANLASEVGLVALDCLGLYCTHLRDALLTEDSPITDKIFDIYLAFLQVGQSEHLATHVFAALRAFINNFSPVLFQGTARLCGRLCSELLRCCNSRLPSARHEACAILYLLMRSNFEFTTRQGLTRVHLQLVMAVSQLLGCSPVDALNSSRVQESLSLINSFANSDKAMKGTGFPAEVRQLTRRVRTVLMATAQMREHDHEPEVLNELQLSLADSYACTPELRCTWLQALSKNHEAALCPSEAASCQLHIAALQAEYLRQKGRLSWGADSFAEISPNIAQDERNLKLDAGAAEAQFCESSLLEQLERCARMLEKAERHELQVPLYRLITPLYESRRDYVALSAGFNHLALACTRSAECARGGRRLLGTYYRVVFYGQACSEEGSHGVEFIYKEPKVTSLAELSERLTQQFAAKFGPGAVKIVADSALPSTHAEDQQGGWVLVTHVTPYWEPADLALRPTLFERAHHNVRRFMFDTPFTKDGPAQGGPAQQWKRRTILTTSKCFPYVVRRLPVVERHVTELGPLTVALHEMRQRVADLEEVVFCSPPDAKRLQLILQGSVCVQVNAGPMAYATAFLDPTQESTYPEEELEELRDVFRDFVHMCQAALNLNAGLVGAEQHEYQEVLTRTFHKMCRELAALFCEPLGPGDDSKRHSRALFSAISGASSGSSCA